VLDLLPFYLLGFLGIGLTGGPVEKRRPHFWLRLLLAALLPVALLLTIPGLAALGVASSKALDPLGWLVLFLCIPLVMLAPALLYERPDPFRGGGGWGDGRRGPDSPPPPPDKPGGGGLPLPMRDAVQARVRLREPGRPWRFEPARRPAREPARSPERV
jgi:hypothetical protein